MSYTKRKDGRLMKKVTFEGKAHYVYGRTPSEIKDKIDKLNRKYYLMLLKVLLLMKKKLVLVK